MDGPAQVRDVAVDRLSSEIQFRYAITKTTKVGLSAALFPVEAAKTVLNSLGHASNLRLLRGVTHARLLREDSSVLDVPGYDGASKRAYLPLLGFAVRAVPGRPSPAEVEEARDLIATVIEEFPFNTDHDRANFWCALLTPLLREITPPPYKMAVINAHQGGSGKSLLAWIPREPDGGVLRGDARRQGRSLASRSPLSCPPRRRPSCSATT